MPVRLGPGVASWAVLSSDGKTALPAQLLPASPEDAILRTDYYGAAAANMSWLAFIPPSLPAVGYSLVFLVPVAAVNDAPSTSVSVVTPVSEGVSSVMTLGNLTLGFDSSGLLANYTAVGGITTALHHNFMYYSSSLGDKTDAQVVSLGRL